MEFKGEKSKLGKAVNEDLYNNWDKLDKKLELYENIIVTYIGLATEVISAEILLEETGSDDVNSQELEDIHRDTRECIKNLEVHVVKLKNMFNI